MAATCMSFSINIKFCTLFTVKMQRFLCDYFNKKKLFLLRTLNDWSQGRTCSALFQARTEFLNVIQTTVGGNSREYTQITGYVLGGKYIAKNCALLSCVGAYFTGTITPVAISAVYPHTTDNFLEQIRNFFLKHKFKILDQHFLSLLRAF